MLKKVLWVNISKMHLFLAMLLFLLVFAFFSTLGSAQPQPQRQWLCSVWKKIKKPKDEIPHFHSGGCPPVWGRCHINQSRDTSHLRDRDTLVRVHEGGWKSKAEQPFQTFGVFLQLWHEYSLKLAVRQNSAQVIFFLLSFGFQHNIVSCLYFSVLALNSLLICGGARPPLIRPESLVTITRLRNRSRPMLARG